MLLKEGCIAKYSYKELVDKLNDKNSYKALSVNFKSYISKFKKKFKDSIAQCEKVLVNKEKKEILDEINNLLYYKLETHEYVMYTKFEIVNQNNIK